MTAKHHIGRINDDSDPVVVIQRDAQQTGVALRVRVS